MSYNRLSYDAPAYKKSLQESVSSFNHIMEPLRFENCKKCSHQLGLVGGRDVSLIRGNMIDLENDLRGQTRPQSLSPEKKWQPSQSSTLIYPGVASQGRAVDLTPIHLPVCQMFELPRPAYPDPYTPPTCDSTVSR